MNHRLQQRQKWRHGYALYFNLFILKEPIRIGDVFKNGYNDKKLTIFILLHLVISGWILGSG